MSRKEILQHRKGFLGNNLTEPFVKDKMPRVQNMNQTKKRNSSCTRIGDIHYYSTTGCMGGNSGKQFWIKSVWVVSNG